MTSSEQAKVILHAPWCEALEHLATNSLDTKSLHGFSGGSQKRICFLFSKPHDHLWLMTFLNHNMVEAEKAEKNLKCLSRIHIS